MAEIVLNEESHLHLSCKRAKLSGGAGTNEPEEAKEDRLSNLLDCLILHILSFLSTKEVVKTCVLSKRWRFQWTHISKIDLVEKSSDLAKSSRFVDFVGRMLFTCNGVRSFAVDFFYQPGFVTAVNLWVDYALKNKVKDITFNFHQTPLEVEENYYILPQMLFSCSFLSSLNVRHCKVDPLGAIGWGSLKSLSLFSVKLLKLDTILLGCSVLEDLKIIFCHGLNLVKISSASITNLMIVCWTRPNSIFEITSPNLRVLMFIENFSGSRFSLKGASSLVTVNIDICLSALVEIIDMEKLFKSLRSTKELELGWRCIVALGLLERKCNNFPTLPLKRLTLKPVSSWKVSIPGILEILRYSPFLESLFIEGISTSYLESERSVSFSSKYKNTWDSIALDHLKTVKITNFVKRDLSCESFLPLMRILLKRAKVLEKMVINVEESVIDQLSRTLVSFPRASPNAVVLFGTQNSVVS